MGQKSNLTTIYSNKTFLNLSTLNDKFYVIGYTFLLAIRQLFLRKHILIANECLNFNENKLFLKCALFFESTKLKVYKKKKKVKVNLFKVKKNNFFSVMYILFLKQFQLNHIITSFTVLNHKIDRRFSKYLFNALKPFIKSLFNRRFNLFLDFIKLSSLFRISKIDLKNFLYYVTEIFKYLQKKSHGRFFTFMKQVFTHLISSITHSSISGVKLLIKGRLKGKQMASSLLIQQGLLSTQRLSNNIEFAKMHTFTQHFGVFGFKIWICKK